MQYLSPPQGLSNARSGSDCIPEYSQGVHIKDKNIIGYHWLIAENCRKFDTAPPCFPE